MTIEQPQARSVHVVILMATYNGAAYLDAQLQSFAAQDHGDWSLIVSDDGSSDQTLAIIRSFAAAHPANRITVLDGPKQGPAANFMSLLARLPAHAPTKSYVAFADQDDVWLPVRLSRGLDAIGGYERPAAWCARTWVTGPALENPRLSAPRPRPLGFRNALVQNVMAGNTILLNPAAASLTTGLAAQAGNVVMHDWWLYLMLTGCGATVFHDNSPCLYYRQHSDNEIGANSGFLARVVRLRLFFGGRFRVWNQKNLEALALARPAFSQENADLVDLFARACRAASLRDRLDALHKARLYRQSLAGTAAVWAAVCVGLL